MATDINAFGQFSDGTFGSFRKEGATAETVANVQTGGVGLAQVSGVDIGQAYVGKTLVAMAVQVQTDDATTGVFCHAYILGPDGKIRPIVMEVGMTLQATFDAAADAATQLGSYVVYCSDGTSDVFTAKGIDATKTSMVNKDGSTIGQALSGKSIVCAYATYGSTKGLNDNGEGNGGFYIERADGQLKMMHPPAVFASTNAMVPYVEYSQPVKIEQNDTLSIMSAA
jgi:hypothetical protein